MLLALVGAGRPVSRSRCRFLLFAALTSHRRDAALRLLTAGLARGGPWRGIPRLCLCRAWTLQHSLLGHAYIVVDGRDIMVQMTVRFDVLVARLSIHTVCPHLWQRSPGQWEGQSLRCLPVLPQRLR